MVNMNLVAADVGALHRGPQPKIIFKMALMICIKLKKFMEDMSLNNYVGDILRKVNPPMPTTQNISFFGNQLAQF
jgi:hypothetical protein